jgi:hypothetical protein
MEDCTQTRKNEIWSAGSQDISSLNLGVVNSSQTYGNINVIGCSLVC